MSLDFRLDDQPELTVETLKQVLAPIEKARGLPNPCYTNAKAIELERQRVFAGGWACAGFAMDIPTRGDLYPFEFAGLPLFMARLADGSIRVYHNVCQHRGRTLVTAAKNVKKAVVCPYHSWTYGLDGKLIGTPHLGGPGKHECPGFNKANIALSPIRSAEWFGLVFVDLSGTAEDFATYIAPIAERWQAFEGLPLVHTGADCRIDFELDCNWKLAIENYCEAYHLPWVHPELNRYSPLERHYAIIEEGYSGQGSECYAPVFAAGTPAFPNAPGLPDFWQAGAEYIALYPNLLLGLHRDHFYAVLIQPDGASRTRERFEIFYYDERVRAPAFDAARAANRELWQTIFAEDRDAVESMQRGRRSPGFDGGVFSPVMDRPTQVFHVWIARALLEGRRPKQAAGE